jgi:hypothetical protein
MCEIPEPEAKTDTAPVAEPINTRESIGEAYEIPLNHELARQHSCRRDELTAIASWARTHGIPLREEAAISRVPSENGPRVRVLIYEHRPQMAQPQPETRVRHMTETIEN